jgi:multidrug efflux pump
MTIGATLLIFALGIVGMGKVQQQFFPDSSRPEILVDIWCPRARRSRNEEVAKRFEQRLMKEPGVPTVSTWVGSGVPRFYLPLDQVFPQTNVSQLIILPKDLKVRECLRIKLPALLATEFPEARPRQAAAQRPAGAVPGAVPRDRHRPVALRDAPTRSRR